MRLVGRFLKWALYQDSGRHVQREIEQNQRVPSS